MSQPELPPGHYVFGVAVRTFTKLVKKGGSPTPVDYGQTVASGDLPPYGQWK